MRKFIEIEFQNKTTLVDLSDIRMMELEEDNNALTLTLYMGGDTSICVDAGPGEEKWVRNLYTELKAKLEGGARASITS